ncbi:MAG: hypothetical protein GY719_10460 [bacterium]|nr:hypothetical protein [bacterium]
MTTLADKLTALREGAKDRIPADALAIMHQAVEDLRASGIRDRVLGPGEPMPAFELENVHGEMVDSRALLARGPLILTFYRGVW